MVDQTFTRDGNHVPITNRGLLATKTITYTGAANLGAVGATTLFTVTGPVIVNIFAVCTGDLTGATATVEVGISGNTAALIALTTATEIDTGEVWVDTAPATIEAPLTDKIIGNGQDIIETVATAAVSGGTLTYYCFWTPCSNTASVVAA